MDYTELANGFATIVGLLSSFISHRKEDQFDYEEFLNWLKEHHLELSNQILANNKIADEIKNMLHHDRDLLLEKLEELDKQMATFACSFQITRGLAEAIRPGAKLPVQAISILQQLVDSGGSWILELSSKNGVKLLVYDSNSNINIEIKERRFLYDDLKKLLDAGLLLHDLNSAGNNKYILTRSGYSFIKNLRSE